MSSTVHNSDDTPGSRLPSCDPDALSKSNAFLYMEAEKFLATLPNDLTRIIYLASIRDYNTGLYLHPELSRCYAADLVDCALKLHHAKVFQNLLETPVRDYVDQLRLYISFAGVTRAELIATWRDLEVYKSAIPLQHDKTNAEVFFLNVFSALCVLDNGG